MLNPTTTEQLPDPAQDGDEWPLKSPVNETYPELPPGQSWPKISIVTPSFNQGSYLEKTIRSVLLQGYPNLEYVIIDGGSTDQSVDVIKKYAQWIDFWVSEKDQGQSNAINKGLARSSGELLGWLNSDDYYLPGALFKIARAYIEDGSVGAISSTNRALSSTLRIWCPLPRKVFSNGVLVTTSCSLPACSLGGHGRNQDP
jgi:glycosyltransferase involved in cell wall biosynthesis